MTGQPANGASATAQPAASCVLGKGQTSAPSDAANRQGAVAVRGSAPSRSAPPRHQALEGGAVGVGRLVAWKGLRLALAALRRPEAT